MNENTFNQLRGIYPNLNLNNNFEFISSFTILWNLFEMELNNNGYHSINYYGFHNTIIDDGNFANLDNNDYLAFWRQKGNYNSLNPFFEFDYKINPTSNLLLKIKNTIEGRDLNTQNINYTVFCINYRIRNNLFHGRKRIEHLGQQENIFNRINDNLIKTLRYIKLNGMTYRQNRNR